MAYQPIQLNLSQHFCVLDGARVALLVGKFALILLLPVRPKSVGTSHHVLHVVDVVLAFFNLLRLYAVGILAVNDAEAYPVTLSCILEFHTLLLVILEI